MAGAIRVSHWPLPEQRKFTLIECAAAVGVPMAPSKPLDKGGCQSSFPLALARETKVHSDRVRGAGELLGGKVGQGGAVAREPREVQEAKRAESQACQGGQGGQAGQGDTKSLSKTRTLSQKVRQKHVPLGRKSEPRRGTNITTICVKNVNP